MTSLVISVSLVAVVMVTMGWFLLGFRLGGRHWQSRLLHSQLETVKARRQLYDLTREAFVAMADHAHRTVVDKGK
jgi:hypothetical protein